MDERARHRAGRLEAERDLLAEALLTLWYIEGGECQHGVGFEHDCDHRPCEHNEVRAALRAAARAGTGDAEWLMR